MVTLQLILPNILLTYERTESSFLRMFCWECPTSLLDADVEVAFEVPPVAEDDDVALEDAFDIAIITDSLELKSLFLHDQYHQIHTHVFPICLC